MNVKNNVKLMRALAEGLLKKKRVDRRHYEILLNVTTALLQHGEQGAYTRDIANACDMSIYAARNWLLKLEK